MFFELLAGNTCISQNILMLRTATVLEISHLPVIITHYFPHKFTLLGSFLLPLAERNTNTFSESQLMHGEKTYHPQGKDREQEYLGNACVI